MSFEEGHNQVPLQAILVGCPAFAEEYHLANFRLSSLSSDVAPVHHFPDSCLLLRALKGYEQVPVHAIIIQGVRRLACASARDFSGLSTAQQKLAQ